MKRLINLLILQILTFVSFSQTRTTSGDAIRKEITPKYVNGVIKQLTIAQLKVQPISNGDSTTLYYVTDTGKKGYFELDKNDNSSIGNDSTIIVTNNGKRLKRTIEQYLAPSTTGKYYRGDKTWQDLNKASVGLSNVDNTSDLNKPVSTLTKLELDSKLNISDYTLGITTLGGYNAFTNTPSLSSTPPSNINDGGVYDVTTSGTSVFSGINFSTGTMLQVGDQLKKQGNQWYLIQNSIIPDYVKGIIGHNKSIAIDDNIANAIKDIYLELKGSWANGSIAVKSLGYDPVNGLGIFLYNTTNSTNVTYIKFDNSTSKPSGVKSYTIHTPNNLFLQIRVDWNSFSVSNLVSTTFSTELFYNNYNSNRLSFTQFSNGIKSYSENGIDENINYAIKYIKFESVSFSDNWSVSTLGWDGTAVYLRVRNNTSGATTAILLASGSQKPSGVQFYRVNNPYNYYLELQVDWGSFVNQNLISTSYSALIITQDYNNERLLNPQFFNGITGFSRNGTDERIAFAIKKIYFEYIDEAINFSVKQVGWDGSGVVLLLRNLTSNSDYKITLESVGSKPSGLKSYEINKKGEYYLYLEIDYNSFPSQSILSSTNTTSIRTYRYNSYRNNDLDKSDENYENIRFSSPKKYVNGQINWNLYNIEPGTVTSAQDAANGNRLRTKYSIRVKPGSVLSYNIATNYKILLSQVKTNGVKQYILIKDSGALTGSGSLAFDTNVESIRLVFIKTTNGTTETLISPSEINTSIFNLSTDFAFVDQSNQATQFTDDQLMNSWIKELYIEGLDKSQSYIISHVRRNVSGSWRLYIKNKSTNVVVFQFGVNPAYDFNETGIFDRTVSGVRVRAVFDWSVLPVGYHNLDPTTQINLIGERIFNIKYSPTIANYYQDKVVRGSKLLSSRLIAGIDNNSVANSILPYKNLIPAFMNSLNADAVKSSTLVTYDTIAYAKNGSVGIEVGGKVYEFCQERDTDIYDATSNIFVRVIDLATKTMLSKTKVLGFGDTIDGLPMTKIPYCYSGTQIDNNTIRLYIRTRTSSGEKYVYIDYNISTMTFTAPISLTLNGGNFDISSYYTYIRDNVDNTLTTSFANSNIGLSLGKHTQKYGSYYYSLLCSNVGLNPYSGTYFSIIRSTDGINWTVLYVFSDFKNGQDDGDMYIKDGILYAQLRQTFGTLRSVLVAYNLTTNKEITSQTIKSATCRAEFFEHSGNLYMLINLDENRQYGALYKIIFDSSKESIDLITVLTTEAWNANWSIHSYGGIIYVFFGVQVWELKMDTYNTSVSNKLFDLLKN